MEIETHEIADVYHNLLLDGEAAMEIEVVVNALKKKLNSKR